MGYPVTVDNFSQQANLMGEELRKQADQLGAEMRKQVDHEFDKYKANHQAWAKTFLDAEKKRRDAEKEWRDFYWKVYSAENNWWKTTTMFALNGIQLWALYTQYKQQKEIANRVYELADRQQRLAEKMYAYYKQSFQPHETELGKQIDNYFANPYRPQHEITGGRFALNARMQMIGKRREVLMCASQYCTGAVRTSLRDLALQEANLVGNAMNSAVKYENLRELKMEQKWLQTRLAFIQAGRGVADQGVTGIDGAVNAFHRFGADPGSTLSQLLTTVAYTVGGIIDAPDRPTAKRVRPAPIYDAQPATVKGQTRISRTG